MANTAKTCYNAKNMGETVMRKILIAFSTVAFVSLTAAAEPGSPALGLDNPAYADPAKKWDTIDEAVATLPEVTIDLGACRDMINKARIEAGQMPLFDRETASPDTPQMIYAVDRREGGCSVMVMKGDMNDIRPLPTPPATGAQLIPAEKRRK